MPIRHTVSPMSTPDTESVAAEVRAALARRQITQTTLAEVTGRSQAYWSRRLSGRQPMSVADLTTVADLAAVPLASLLESAA